MTDWFYRIGPGKELGPFPSKHLLELIRTGEIDGETEVRKDDSQWVQARQVKGLWQAVGMPTVAFRCPFCGSHINRPPTKCSHCEKPVAKAVGQLVQHDRPTVRPESWMKSEPAPTPKAPPLQ